jgi:hypothetical protein
VKVRFTLMRNHATMKGLIAKYISKRIVSHVAKYNYEKTYKKNA